MLKVVICEMFGWTYDEYMNQPKPFIDLITEKISIDSQKAAKQLKQ